MMVDAARSLMSRLSFAAFPVDPHAKKRVFALEGEFYGCRIFRHAYSILDA